MTHGDDGGSEEAGGDLGAETEALVHLKCFHDFLEENLISWTVSTKPARDAMILTRALQLH